jgi:hypothetical protein
VTDNYRIENSRLEPAVMLSVSGGNLDLSLSYVVNYAKRDIIKDKIFTDIVDQVARSDGRLKWPSSSTIVNVNRATEYPLPRPDCPG